MWVIRSWTLVGLLLFVGLFTFLPHLRVPLFASSTSSPAFEALSAVHYLVKREKVGGLTRLVSEAQIMVHAADREGRGQAVEQECDGWVTTLKYCGNSPTQSDGVECLCSSTALARMAICHSALASELQGAFADFTKICGTTRPTLDSLDNPAFPPSSSRQDSRSSAHGPQVRAVRQDNHRRSLTGLTRLTRRDKQRGQRM